MLSHVLSQAFNQKAFVFSRIFPIYLHTHIFTHQFAFASIPFSYRYTTLNQNSISFLAKSRNSANQIALLENANENPFAMHVYIIMEHAHWGPINHTQREPLDIIVRPDMIIILESFEMQIRRIIRRVVHMYLPFSGGAGDFFQPPCRFADDCLLVACCCLFYAVLKSIQQNFICTKSQKKSRIENNSQWSGEKSQENA